MLRNLNLLDILFLILAAFAAYRGWSRGLLGLVFELGGGFLGLLVGIAMGPRIAGLFTDVAGLEGALISLLVVFVFLSIGQTIGYILGHRSGAYAANMRLGRLNSALGAVAGALLITLVYWIVGSMFVQGPSRPVARALQRSAVLRGLNDTLHEPPNVLSYFQQYLNTADFPQVFAGLPPIGPPVRGPSNAEANRAIRAADQSTVRVVVPACGGTQLGSGWIAADSTVVTNAHVVAGGDDVQISSPAGENVAGDVVLFDEDTDVAIIRLASPLNAPALPLETSPLGRNEPGATLGYPGDLSGRAEYSGAAIQARYDARGRDIYGRSIVTREVYELRARVRQGDSGGPFVLPNGRVAGVVFAASTTDSNTGYALTGAEVQDEVAEGAQRSQAVSTGPCTR